MFDRETKWQATRFRTDWPVSSLSTAGEPDWDDNLFEEDYDRIWDHLLLKLTRLQHLSLSGVILPAAAPRAREDTGNILSEPMLTLAGRLLTLKVDDTYVSGYFYEQKRGLCQLLPYATSLVTLDLMIPNCGGAIAEEQGGGHQLLPDKSGHATAFLPRLKHFTIKGYAGLDLVDLIEHMSYTLEWLEVDWDIVRGINMCFGNIDTIYELATLLRARTLIKGVVFWNLQRSTSRGTLVNGSQILPSSSYGSLRYDVFALLELLGPLVRWDHAERELSRQRRGFF